MFSGGRYAYLTLATLVALLVATPPATRADTVISDFDSAPPGSSNPRADWSAFGNGTTDAGVQAAGSSGQGAYHSVAWGSSTWGIGDGYASVVDLSAYTAVRVDARVVGISGYSGTAKLRFALDLPASTEWSTPSVAITSAYQTYSFNFSTLAQTAGSGALDLTAGTPKFIVEKNGQAGSARFDFDQVVAVGATAGYELTPVTLRPPPDGDAIRAMWFYDYAAFDSAAASQAVLDFCAREGVNRIHCDAYHVCVLGTSTQKEHLRTFIATAHASGIRMEALLGDSNWHNNKSIVRTRIGQVLALHNATPGDSTDDFDSIHLDAEFWLDSSWTGATTESQRQQVARNYLDNVLVTARNYLNTNGAEAVDTAADLSAHTDTTDMLPSPMLYDGVTQYFLRHVLDHADDVVLMSYYDAAGTLVTVTGPELDMAVAEGRTIQLGANIQTGELPNNTFADNSPTPYSAMTTVLETFHQQLSASRRIALAGFSVFHYGGFSSFAPEPGNIADWDGDGDADLTDYKGLRPHLLGPGTAATGLACDADLDLDGDVDLGDFALFTRCFAGPGVTGPFPSECDR